MKRGYAALFGKSLNFRINRKKGFRKILKSGNFLNSNLLRAYILSTFL